MAKLSRPYPSRCLYIALKRFTFTTFARQQKWRKNSQLANGCIDLAENKYDSDKTRVAMLPRLSIQLLEYCLAMPGLILGKH